MIPKDPSDTPDIQIARNVDTVPFAEIVLVVRSHEVLTTSVVRPPRVPDREEPK